MPPKRRLCCVCRRACGAPSASPGAHACKSSGMPKAGLKSARSSEFLPVTSDGGDLTASKMLIDGRTLGRAGDAMSPCTLSGLGTSIGSGVWCVLECTTQAVEKVGGAVYACPCLMSYGIVPTGRVRKIGSVTCRDGVYSTEDRSDFIYLCIRTE